MGRPIGQLDRVLDGLTTDLALGQQSRAKQLAQGAAREVEQQVRVAIGGEAGTGWNFVDKPVRWPQPFIWAPAQRDVPFRTPHFSYGIEMRSAIAVHEEVLAGMRAPTAATAPPAPPPLVIIHAQILRWVTNNSSLVEGATIRFTATAPGTPEKVKFSAVAHLTFQGWAAETEEGEEA